MSRQEDRLKLFDFWYRMEAIFKFDNSVLHKAQWPMAISYSKGYVQREREDKVHFRRNALRMKELCGKVNHPREGDLELCYCGEVKYAKTQRF